MNRKCISRIQIWTGFVAALLPGVADGQRAEVVSEASARGIVVLQASFPSRGELHSFALEISLDRETFVDARVGPLRGLRLSDDMVKGAGDRTEQTVLMVPIVGVFDLTPKGFIFSEPGVYHLRWDIAFRDRAAGDLKIHQTVKVMPPMNSDLAFIATVGDRTFLRKVFGLDPPEGGTTELLALGLIGELLTHAQDDPGEEGNVPGKLEWADPLMELAQSFPDSSYAPYTAFYAARLYLQNLIRIPEFSNIAPAAKDHELYRKANDALVFTIQRADPFLRPRALCTLAYLRVCAASWEDADVLLARAEESALGQGSVLAVVEELRGDLVRISERLKQSPGP